MRSFIAIELPEEIKGYLSRIQGQLKKSAADVKWVLPGNIHLTLKFLGEISPDEAKDITRVLEEISRNKNPFTVRLSSPGAFPGINSPRVIWVGVEKGDSEVRELAKNIEEELNKIGIPEEEREFSSHITLGRTKSGLNRAVLIKLLADLQNQPQAGNPEFKVNHITLFKSTLTPKGPIYEVVKKCDLTEQKNGQG
jgi:2'-5' RNA ligase